MRVTTAVLTVTLPLALAACSSTSQLDGPKSERVLGRDANVRVQAEIVADATRPNSLVRVVCVVENLRPDAIQIAAVDGEGSWDSGVFTVNVGSELPVSDSSRMITLGPNEKRTFHVSTPLRSREARFPGSKQLVRVKLHFLEAGALVADLGGDMWDAWMESKQSVITNAIPLAGSPLGSGPPVDAGIRRPVRR